MWIETFDVRGGSRRELLLVGVTHIYWRWVVLVAVFYDHWEDNLCELISCSVLANDLIAEEYEIRNR